MRLQKLLFSCMVVAALPLSGFSQVFNTDVIVIGSICIGFDCVNGENFGSDTQRLKENNLRIHFDDTSNSGSFPSNDWRITINDSGNGGENYFAIDDATANNRPFKIEAGAGANAMVIDSDANVGIGTGNPVVELQITDGDSPTLRLEQNGSAGFTSQTWDIAGNETNFFVRDVTHSSKIPFKIIPAAPDNSLYINSNGNVTLGGTDNVSKLFVNGDITTDERVVFRPSGTNLFSLMVNSGPSFAIRDELTGNDVIVINEEAGANSIFIHDGGAVSIGSTLENEKLYVDGGLVVNGNIRALSDRRIKKDITDLNYGLSEILALAPKQYNFYNADKYQLNLDQSTQLGLIAQEVQKIIPEVVSNDVNVMEVNGTTSTLKSINYTSLIPVLIQAIKEQQEQLNAKDSELIQLKNELQSLNAKVDAIYKRMGQDVEYQEHPITDKDDMKSSSEKNISENKENKEKEKLNNGRSPKDKPNQDKGN